MYFDDLTGRTWEGSTDPEYELDPLDEEDAMELERLRQPWRCWQGTGVLTAAALNELFRLRTIQRKRSRPGHLHRLPSPGSRPDRTQRSMHSVRIPDGIQFLRRALGLLTTTLKADGGDLPPLEAVVLSRRPTYVELHLAQPRPPVAPFTTDPDRPGVWRCEASSAALRPGEKFEPVVEPYPGLVSLGWDQEGRVVLIDMEYVGVLHLTGDAQRSRFLYQALATELATTAFARRLPLAFVGRTATELTTVVRNSRALPADRAAAEIRAVAADQRTRLQALGIDSPRSARPHDQEPASWLGQVVLCHDTRAADLSDVPLLVDTRAAWPQSTMSVVALAPDGVPMPSGAWTLNCSAQDDVVLLPGSGMPVRLHQLDDVGFADVIELLTIGHSTEDEPGPSPADPVQ